jgi:hypothetical protein
MGGIYQRGALDYLLDPDEKKLNDKGVLRFNLE